jgi:hypothetical protein
MIWMLFHVHLLLHCLADRLDRPSITRLFPALSYNICHTGSCAAGRGKVYAVSMRLRPGLCLCQARSQCRDGALALFEEIGDMFDRVFDIDNRPFNRLAGCLQAQHEFFAAFSIKRLLRGTDPSNGCRSISGLDPARASLYRWRGRV